jgi:hypothetical protein
MRCSNSCVVVEGEAVGCIVVAAETVDCICCVVVRIVVDVVPIVDVGCSVVDRIVALRSQKSVPFEHFAYKTLDSKSDFCFNSHSNDSKLSQSKGFFNKIIVFWILFLKNCPNFDSSINVI